MRTEERARVDGVASESPSVVDEERPGSVVRALMVESLIVVVLMACYRGVRTLAKAELVEAFEHARQILDFERLLGMTVEVDIQRWILSRPALIHVVNHYYVWMHFPVVVALLGWVFWRHRSRYSGLRNELIAVTFAALIVHILYPLAPPRMMPGFVDTMTRFGPNIYPASALDGAANQIAAMPSLHFAWALVVAIWFTRLSTLPARHVAMAHPILMSVSIMGTANHWWMDAACAGLLYGSVRLTATSIEALVTRLRRPCVEQC